MGRKHVEFLIAFIASLLILVSATAQEENSWNTADVINADYLQMSLSDRIARLDSYIATFDEETPIPVQLEIYGARVNTLNEAGQYKESSVYGQNVYTRFIDLPAETESLTSFLFYIAQAHVRAAEIEAAFTVLDHIKSNTNSTGETMALLASDSLTAQILSSIGNHQNSIQVMKGILENEAYKDQLNAFSETSLLSSIGNVWARDGNYTSALDYLSQAETAIKNYQQQDLISQSRAEVKLNIVRIRRARVYALQGRFSEVSPLVKVAYDEAQQHGKPDIAAEALYLTGLYQKNKGLLSEASVSFEQSKQLAVEAGAADVLMPLTRDQSLLLAELGRHQEAYDLLLQYNEMHEARQQEQSSGRLALAYTQARRAERDREFQRLREANETATAISKRDRRIAMLSMVAVAMMLIGFTALSMLYFHQRKAKNRLKESEHRAKEASKAKSSFLANMSHEIRTPMNGILGMAELLQKTKLDDKQNVFASTIYESGSALLTIINDILDYSKIEAGKLELDPAPMDLATVVDDVASLLGISAREKGIELMVRIRPGTPTNAIGDAGRIRQALTNIVGNAIKFTHEGTVLIDVAGTVENDMANVQINISDTGIGMSPEQLAIVFDEFTQAESSTTRKFGGTGLGLSITKGLIKAMGGIIEVDSTLGKGSEFSFNLSMPVTNAIDIVTYPEIEFNNETVLVVDDNETNRVILKENLQMWGLQSVLAESANEALAILKNANSAEPTIRMMITDYHMPERDGLFLIQEVVERHRNDDIAFIVLSSANNDMVTKEFKALGASDIFAKPVRMPMLRKALSDALVRKNISTLKSIAETVANDQGRAEASEETLSEKKPHVLIAEDNQVNRLVIEQMIDTSLYDLDFAENGSIAYQKFRANAYAFIFMDISMPVMDGVETTKAIRAYEAERGMSETPIVALTAHAMTGDRDRLIAEGMNDYVSKPIKQTEVQEMLAKWILADVDKSAQEKLSI